MKLAFIHQTEHRSRLISPIHKYHSYLNFSDLHFHFSQNVEFIILETTLPSLNREQIEIDSEINVNCSAHFS